MVIAIINAGQRSACEAYWVAEERGKKGPAHTRIQLDHYWRWREESKKGWIGTVTFFTTSHIGRYYCEAYISSPLCTHILLLSLLRCDDIFHVRLEDVKNKKPFSIHFIENISVLFLSPPRLFLKCFANSPCEEWGGFEEGGEPVGNQSLMRKIWFAWFFPSKMAALKRTHMTAISNLFHFYLLPNQNSIRVSRWNNERWSNEIGQFNWLLF